MQNRDQKLSQVKSYRSAGQRDLVVTEQQSVVTLVTESAPPFITTLYMEEICNGKYVQAQIIYNSPLELKYGGKKTRGSLEYEVNKPGISFNKSQSNDFRIGIGDVASFSKAVSQKEVVIIRTCIYNVSESYPKLNNTEQKSLSFFKKVLSHAGVFTEAEEFALTSKSIKYYPRDILQLWKNYVALNFNIYYGPCYSHPIDKETETNFSAEILPLDSDKQSIKSPEARLTHFFKNHVNRTHVIDWKSEEGQKIQFLHSYFGLCAFSYNEVVKRKELSIIFPLALVEIIIEYGKEHSAKFAYMNPVVPKHRS